MVFGFGSFETPFHKRSYSWPGAYYLAQTGFKFWSPCLSSLSPAIRDMCHHTCLEMILRAFSFFRASSKAYGTLLRCWAVPQATDPGQPMIMKVDCHGLQCDAVNFQRGHPGGQPIPTVYSCSLTMLCRLGQWTSSRCGSFVEMIPSKVEDHLFTSWVMSRAWNETRKWTACPGS